MFSPPAATFISEHRAARHSHCTFTLPPHSTLSPTPAIHPVSAITPTLFPPSLSFFPRLSAAQNAVTSLSAVTDSSRSSALLPGVSLLLHSSLLFPHPFLEAVVCMFELNPSFPVSSSCATSSHDTEEPPLLAWMCVITGSGHVLTRL